MTVIACTKCGIRKLRSDFHKNSAAPGRLRLECKACRREAAIIAYSANPAASKKRSTEWARANIDRVKITQQRHNEKCGERRRAGSRAWQKANLAKDAERSARQRAVERRATPEWADRRYIKLFYEMARLESERTGRPVQVDHIVPLNSPVVCGLHVEHNLQLLFARDNIAKGNRFNGGGLSLRSHGTARRWPPTSRARTTAPAAP